jgi:acetylornithine deacetylase/succinyl-diaminopimelate desuccinylase-like protein
MAKFANPKAAAAARREPSYVGQTRTTCVATIERACPERVAAAAANVNCLPGVKIEDVRLALAGSREGVEVRWTSVSAPPLRNDILAAVTRVVHKFLRGIITPAGFGATDGLPMFGRNTDYGVDPTFIRDKDAFAHGLNERLPVKSFYDGLEMWYLLVKDLAGTAKKR